MASGRRLAGLVVAREEVEGFALPAPVLHDLRGDLDPVPGDVDAAARGDLDARGGVVEEVAELVEEGADLAVGQQRGAGGGGRGEVAADEGEVGAEAAVGGGAAGDQAVHPRALPLGLAGKPVGVEGSQVASRLVSHLEIADVGVPDSPVVHPLDGEAEEALRDLEESGLNLVKREPGAKHLVVHVEALLAQLLHQPGDVPGLGGAEAGACCMRLDFAGVALVKGTGAVDELVQEGADARARAGHQRFEAIVGKVGETEQPGDLAPYLEDACDERPVVALARRAAVQVGRVDLVTEGAVVGVLQDRMHAGHVEGDQPALLAPAGRELGGAFEGGVREAGQRRGVGGQLAVGGGLLQEMLLEPPAQFGQFEAAGLPASSSGPDPARLPRGGSRGACGPGGGGATRSARRQRARPRIHAAARRALRGNGAGSRTG